MIEWILIIVLTIAITRIAAFEGYTGFITYVWGIGAFGCCLLSAYILPLPLVRILIAFIVMIVAMTIVKMLKRDKS